MYFFLLQTNKQTTNLCPGRTFFPSLWRSWCLINKAANYTVTCQNILFAFSCILKAFFPGAPSHPILKRTWRGKQALAERKGETGHESNGGGPEIGPPIPSEEKGAIQ